ncbi:hypothetical protein TWF730_006549 [Orbilia blumenaviensis]|uniref:Peptidase C14 caspase domain-containing protein n=1 Tax=Orbilia blumenaviensis TaxID=1796055 RepID=A0AAV9VG28_9PEZI
MAKPVKKWAVLIGINDYGQGKSHIKRRYNTVKEKREIEFTNLNGCINDIENAEQYLTDVLKVPKENIEKLVIPCPNHLDDKGVSECSQCSTKRPTYKNIVDSLHNIAKSAREHGSGLPKRSKGDLVYIHYSGHGARVTTVYPTLKNFPDEPDSRNSTAYHTHPDKEDDALVPCDILDGGRFLRDVEIAILLSAIVKEGLLPTVVLDCCHSGGTNRHKYSSTEGNDEMVRGIEEVVESTSDDEPESRYIEEIKKYQTEDQYWLYEPKDYVIFAACQKLQKAKERNRSGVFTSCLFGILRSAPLGISSQSLFELVSHRVHKDGGGTSNHYGTYGLRNQTPLLLGDMRRCIFFNERPQAHIYGFTVVEIDTQMRTVQLNGGLIHGVRQDSVYSILPVNSDPGDGNSKPIAQVRVDEVFSGYSEAVLTTPEGTEIEEGLVEGCFAVLKSLPQQERFTVRFIAEDQPLRDEFEKIWKEKYNSNAWLALGEKADAAAFEISLQDAKFVIQGKLVDVATIMQNSLQPLPARGDLPSKMAHLVRILEHSAQYITFKEVALETTDIIDVEVFPTPPDTLQGAENWETLLPVPKMELDEKTGLYQVEERHSFRLKIRNKIDRKVHFAVLIYSPELSINKLYPSDAPYKTLTGVTSSNEGAEDFFDMETGIIDELRDAAGRGWDPIETCKVFASVCANDLLRLSSLTLSPLHELDLSQTKSGQSPISTMQSEPQSLSKYFERYDTEGEDREDHRKVTAGAPIPRAPQWQTKDISIKVTKTKGY